jgi:hypothetical protein
MSSAPSTPLAAKLALVLALIAAGLGGAALALELSAPAVEDRIVFTHNASPGDDSDDKGTRAQCPRGSTLLGGGAAVQHGHATPSVAVYQGLPIDGGWELKRTRPIPRTIRGARGRSKRSQSACGRARSAAAPASARALSGRSGGGGRSRQPER